MGMDSVKRETFAVQLRTLRRARHLTQEEVASRLNIHRTTYTKYETGAAAPDHSGLLKLAELFGVSVDFLLGREAEADAPETALQENGRTSPLSGQEQELIVAFRKMSPEQQARLLQAAQKKTDN